MSILYSFLPTGYVMITDHMPLKLHHSIATASMCLSLSSSVLNNLSSTSCCISCIDFFSCVACFSCLVTLQQLLLKWFSFQMYCNFSHSPGIVLVDASSNTISSTRCYHFNGVPVCFSMNWSGSILYFVLFIILNSLLSFRLCSMAI